MRGISYCYPYYMNPTMLGRQYDTWAGYPDELKDKIELVIVDDGSPEEEAAISVARPEGLPKLRIYQVHEDKPWNQHAARNIAAKHANRAWLLMIDMDHEVPADSLRRILAELNDKSKIYKFRRLDAPDLRPKMKDGKEHPHCNSFAIARDLYWRIGGYDERFNDIYGTDSWFRKLAEEYTGPWVQTDIPIVRYAREVIPDASTRTLDRNAFRKAGEKKRIGAQIRADGTFHNPVVLTNEYSQVL